MIRREPTYLSTEVWKCCWLVAQSETGTLDAQNMPRTVTVDEVADRELYDRFKEKRPEIFEHMKEMRKLDQQFIKKLGGEK